MANTEYVTVEFDARDLNTRVTLGDWAVLAAQWGCDLSVRHLPGQPPELTFVPNGPEPVIEPNIGYVRMWE